MMMRPSPAPSLRLLGTVYKPTRLPAARVLRISIASGEAGHKLPAAVHHSAPAPQARTFLTQRNKQKTRNTSFWVPSFPAPPAPDLPSPSSLPPLPSPSVVTQEDAKTGDGRRRIRKQMYLDSLMDKAGEMGLKCSVLDADGNWSAEEGSFRKIDLCRAHDLDPRDLRKLDSLNPSLVPIILTRRSCILISILHIRALIKPDRVIIFSAPGVDDSESAKRFKAHLQANVRAGICHAAQSAAQSAATGASSKREHDGLDGLSYEHRALESILVDTANALEEELAFVRRLVQELLDSFEHDINRDNLRKLLHYNRRLAGFQSRAKYIKSAFDEVLDSDEDLSAMYLTDKVSGHPRALHDHEQLELLLESFVKQAEEIVSEIDTMVANVQSTQEVAELMLDSGRNALLSLDIKVSMATAGLGFGALVAGLFGMNLTSGLEETPYMFPAVAAGASICALLVYLWTSRILRKVRHITLVGRPTSLPQSVREAKEKFVRERAEHDRALEAAAIATEQLVKENSRPIPDYETRWQDVRSSLKSRQGLWDRLFRPHLIRRALLGMKAQPSQVAVTVSVAPTRGTVHPSPQGPASSPNHPLTRPTAPKPTAPPLARSTRTVANEESSKPNPKSLLESGTSSTT